METTFHAAGYTIAVGLQWRALRNETSEKREAAAIAKEAGCKFGVIYRPDFDSSALVGLYQGNKVNRLVCGATWLARTAGSKQDIILVEPITDTMSWVCVIKNGAPLSGYDVVVPNEEIHTHLDGLQQAGESQESPYLVYSRESYIEGSEPADFTQLVTDPEFAGDAKIKPQAIVQIYGVPRSFVLAGTLLIVVAITYVAWGAYRDREREKELELAQQQEMAALSARQKAAIAKVEADARAKMAIELSSRVTGAPAFNGVISSWLDSVKAAPMVIAAWKLTKVVCEGSTCTVTYKREKLGTILDFVSAAKNDGFNVAGANGNVADLTFSADVVKRSDDESVLPKEDAFLWPFTSQMQRMELAGLSFEIKAAETIKVSTEAIPEYPSKVLESTWRVGEFSLGDKRDFFAARDAQDYLKEFRNIAAKRMEIDFTNQNWVIVGNYATN